MKPLFQTELFLGEVQTTPKFVVVSRKTPLPLLINGLPTDSGSLKAQDLTGLQFVGEAHAPPLSLLFVCLGRQWKVEGNRLYYSPPFTSLNLEGGEHYEDDSTKAITFNHLINAVSISPTGLVCKWALYVSTTEAVYEIKFQGTKPLIQRIISSPALGSIGVGVLERPMSDSLPSGTQIVIIPTHKGIFIATDGGTLPLTERHPNVLSNFDYVHIAFSINDYGQYLVFLDALKK